MTTKYEWPPDQELIRMVRENGKAGTGRILNIPPSTLKDHLNRIEDGSFVDELKDDPPEEFIEIPVFYRDYSDLDKLNVYPLGDVHLGSPAHTQERWAEWLSYLEKHSGVSMIGTGDFLNSALKDSKSELYDEVMNVGKGKRLLRKQLEPLAKQGKLDGLAQGNHEARIYRAIGDCPIEDVCDTLSVNYIPASALIVYQVGDITYDLYVRHGTGNANGMIGSRANQLQRSAHVVNADIYLSGHVHNQLAASDNVFIREGDRIIRKRRLYIASGSFVAYERYAAERGYVPTRIGAPRIYLDGTKKDVHVSI